MSNILNHQLNNWRESLNQKYGNPEKTNYEYEEWRHGVKTMLFHFQEEIEEYRNKNRIELEKDTQRMLEINQNKISEKERNKENAPSKKRKFEN
jgi:hypothetical protein